MCDTLLYLYIINSIHLLVYNYFGIFYNIYIYWPSAEYIYLMTKCTFMSPTTQHSRLQLAQLVPPGSLLMPSFHCFSKVNVGQLLSLDTLIQNCIKYVLCCGDLHHGYWETLPLACNVVISYCSYGLHRGLTIILQCALVYKFPCIHI